MKYLLVITRQTRAERPSEAVLEQMSLGVENAIGSGYPLPVPETDSFLLLSNVSDINARITKYLSSPRYTPLSPKLNEGYFIVKYAHDYNMTEEQASIFDVFQLQVYKVDGTNEDYSFNTYAEALDFADQLPASDGYNLIGDRSGVVASSQFVRCRPPLRKIENYFITSEAADLQVVNALGRSEADRF